MIKILRKYFIRQKKKNNKTVLNPLVLLDAQGWAQLMLGMWAYQIQSLSLLLSVHTFLSPSGGPQMHQTCHARADDKWCLPVPWMRLWGAKPGDTLHLLGDHILGKVIMPGQSFQGEKRVRWRLSLRLGTVWGLNNRGQCRSKLYPLLCSVLNWAEPRSSGGGPETRWVICAVLYSPPTPPPGADLEVSWPLMGLGLNPLPLTNCMSLAEPLWTLVLSSGKWGFIPPKIVVIIKTQYKMVRIVPDTSWVFNKCYHHHQYYYYFYWSWTLVFFICGGDGDLSGNNIYFTGL